MLLILRKIMRNTSIFVYFVKRIKIKAQHNKMVKNNYAQQIQEFVNKRKYNV